LVPERRYGVLGYIHDWDAILVRETNDWIALYRTHAYLEYIRLAAVNSGENVQEANKQAQDWVHTLPQLFLD
jgi:hypothetical protein